MERRDFHFDTSRRHFLNVVDEKLRNLFVLLVWHKARGDLGVGFRWDDSLRPFVGVSAPDAADIERRAAGIAFQRAVALFALQGFHAEPLFVGFLIKRDGGNHLAFGRWHFLHVVVEMRDGDASIFVDYVSDELAKHIDGVGHRAAEMSRMKVAVGARHLNLPVGQSAQTRGERGEVGAQHARVGNEDDVAFQQFLVLFKEGGQARRTDFFFPFEDEFHVVFQ